MILSQNIGLCLLSGYICLKNIEMLIEFSVRNFLSFKDEATFSMVASNAVKELENLSEGLCNVFWDINSRNKYLKSAVIYGANGSGKSNLLTAFKFFKKFILTSSNDRQANESIDIIPFLLNRETENEPSSFEMVFVIGNVRFRYGFEVTKDEVVSEWLFAFDLLNSKKESTYFTREYQNIKVSAKVFKEGKGLGDNTRKNALFLSTVAQLNGDISMAIQNWFRDNLKIISGLEDSTTGYTISRFEKDLSFRKNLLNFVKLLGLGIEDIKVEESAIDSLSRIFPVENNIRIRTLLEELQRELDQKRNEASAKAMEVSVSFMRNKFDEANNLIDEIGLDIGLESQGTQKLFGLLGPWFDVLETGKILIIDELDSSLHTKMTVELLKIFQSIYNKENAQLIFASHDTNLLRNDLFRRDQIWFAEKNNFGATEIYSLVEYKINQATSVRNDASYEKDYLAGKYGAIPYFGDITSFLNQFTNE